MLEASLNAPIKYYAKHIYYFVKLNGAVFGEVQKSFPGRFSGRTKLRHQI